MGRDRPDQGTGRHIPELEGRIQRPRREGAAVGAEGYVEDDSGMPPERAEEPAGRRVPELDDPVGTRRGKTTSVRAEGQAIDAPERPADGRGAVLMAGER